MTWELIVRCKEALAGWLADNASLPAALVLGQAGAEQSDLLGSVDGVPVIATHLVADGQLVVIATVTELEQMLTATIQPEVGRITAATRDDAPPPRPKRRTAKR